MRILNAEPKDYSPEARRILATLGEVVERRLTQQEFPEWVQEADILIVRLGLQVDRATIGVGPRLKAIVTATTGLDHIDVPYAESCGITVLSLNGETEFLRTIHATAEHTWALLLALVRRIPEASAAVRQGVWDRHLFRGRELHGRRLGVLGLGRVGEQIAGFGLAFGMPVAAYNPSSKPRWPEGVERCKSLEELLRRSDVLSVHVPLQASTRALLGQRELSLLPEGAVLVNTSRGGVLDEGALVEALASGRLAGAALDTVDGERDATVRQRSGVLAYACAQQNLLITPHLGGATIESMARTEVFMAEKLRRWVEANRFVQPEHMSR